MRIEVRTSSTTLNLCGVAGWSVLLAAALVVSVPARTQAQDEPAAATCWQDEGPQAVGAFNSDAQLALLKSQAASSCAMFGATWRENFPYGERFGYLLWDPSEGVLWRLHTGLMPSWERWSGATRAAIQADDASDGMDLPGYRDGAGEGNLSAAVNAFWREHAPDRF